MDLDDPRTTCLRRRIIAEKRFLTRVYEQWYARLLAELPAGDGPVLEIGSGGGFLRTFIPGLITSDIVGCPELDLVLDASKLPFAPASLRAIVMTNVLHHLSDVRLFFSEASRCVRADGALLMIEPWATTWSTWLYRSLHYEPFDLKARNWDLPSGGPLSGANGALPWIIFNRDRAIFDRDFPAWQIESIQPFMPLSYLLSGGVALRSMLPAALFGFINKCERLLLPVMHFCAMFADIKLRRL
jgi:SAM-dependent methyltransferase